MEEIRPPGTFGRARGRDRLPEVVANCARPIRPANRCSVWYSALGHSERLQKLLKLDRVAGESFWNSN